jgi:phosphoribosylformylglycinamidine synthase
LRSAHDCSDGGVAVTLAESAFDTGGIGLTVDLPRVAVLKSASVAQGFRPASATGPTLQDAGDGASGISDAIATLFGESASRAVVSVLREHRASVLQMAADAGVPAQVIGRTGGPRLTIQIAGQRVIDCTVNEAERIWSTAIERYFAGRAA